MRTTCAIDEPNICPSPISPDRAASTIAFFNLSDRTRNSPSRFHLCKAGDAIAVLLCGTSQLATAPSDL
jgi:hypothetical protein